MRILTSFQLHSFDLAFGASPSGSYGIGVTLDKVGHGPNTGLPTIKEVLPNGSAFSKLACGDVLISVNGQLLDKSAPLKTTMQTIKGAVDTFVDITILRFHPGQFSDETLTFRLKRQPLLNFNLSPSIKLPPPSSTSFYSSTQSTFVGVRTPCQASLLARHRLLAALHKLRFQVNLLTPRIDYPPDPPVQKPSYHRLEYQQTSQLRQWPAHLSPSSPATQSQDGNSLQNHHAVGTNYNQDLLAMNTMNLPPHQHQQLLQLQLQLNHLQQLKVKQQLQTQQLQEVSVQSAASPLEKRNSMSVVVQFCFYFCTFCAPFYFCILQNFFSLILTSSFRPMQPRPWPLPPLRVVSKESGASTALPPSVAETCDNRLETSTFDNNGLSVSQVDNTTDEQNTAISTSLEATVAAVDNPSSRPFEEALDVQKSEINVRFPRYQPFPNRVFAYSPFQVHPSVVNSTDAPRNPAVEAAATGQLMAVDATLSPLPRGPVNRLLPPVPFFQDADAVNFDDELHSGSPESTPADSRPKLVQSPLASSFSYVDEQIALPTSPRSEDKPVALKQLGQDRKAKTNLEARLGFASGQFELSLQNYCHVSTFLKVQRLQSRH